MKKIASFIGMLLMLPLLAMAESDGIVLRMTQSTALRWMLTVELNNPNREYCGFQIDLKAPNEMTFDASSLTLGQRAGSLRANSNIIAGGLLRVVGYAESSSVKINGSAGTIFTVELNASSAMQTGTYEMSAKNIRVTTTDGQETLLPGAACSFNVSAVTTYTIKFWSDNTVFYTTQIAAGDPIPTINTPAGKEGYTFCGWGSQPSVMPAGNLDLYATWCVISYDVNYIVDGQTVHTEKVAYGNPLPPYIPDDKEGYEFLGWKDVPETMPAHDLSLQAQMKAIVYSVSYYVDGDLVHTDSVTYGVPLVLYKYEPEEPNKYIFSGWRGEEHGNMPAKDLEYNGTLILLGDVNLDGFVNSADIVSIYNYIQWGDSSGILLINADVNGDNSVNSADITAIYNLINNGAALSSPNYRQRLIDAALE